MARVNSIVTKFVPYNSQWRSWLDIGTAEGLVAQEMIGYTSMPKKVAMDAGLYPDDLDRGELFQFLDKTWEKVKQNYGPGVTQWTQEYDVITLMDSLQYFQKTEAETLLDHLDHVARRVIVVWTPDGLYPHSGHESGWKGEEFLDRGYCVRKEIGFHQGPPQIGNGLLAWKIL